ncbi:MAG: DUF6069 family protein [Candidatus Dormibacteraeota bacterium]|nr:DUF6069 family protein [Candidatus Dormibacteraeota bacterium]
MATERAGIRIEQRDARGVGGRPGLSWGRLLAVGAGAVAASTIANVLIAQALARLFQVPAAFTALQPAAVASLTVLGVIGAVIVFAALTRLRPDPVRAFTVVATIGLVISWIPDLALYAVGAPGTTVSGVLSLMSLHVVAAGLAVFMLGRYALRPGSREE